MKSPLALSHDFLAQVLTKVDIALDATMGNGHDTAFLASLVGQVYAFDIQEAALEQTKKRLTTAGLTNAQLILDGHENLDQYVSQPIKAAIFNLGYLPSADKSVITLPETTLTALQKILDRLVSGGRVALMVYHGHQGGQTEKDQLLTFVQQLDQRVYTAMLYQPLNQVNTPPFLIMIEKH